MHVIEKSEPSDLQMRISGTNLEDTYDFMEIKPLTHLAPKRRVSATVQVRYGSSVRDELVSTRPQEDGKGSGCPAISLSQGFSDCGSLPSHSRTCLVSHRCSFLGRKKRPREPLSAS